MKLRVLQEDFSKTLAIASRFCSSRAQLPILGNILLSAKKTKLSISSTNLEVSIAVSIGAQVDVEGEITVPAKTITDLASNLSSGQISLSAKKERLTISSASFSSTISGMAPNDFPSIPKSLDKEVIELKNDDFGKALSQVLFATSIDETRPILTGALILFDKKEMLIVATDGFRLSQKKIELPRVHKNLGLIIPRTALAEVLRLSGDVDDISFSFKKSDNQAVFRIDRAVLATRILQGEFPDFKKIIPKNSNHTVRLDREELLQSVKLASIFARESANVVKLGLSQSSMSISSESQHSGEQVGKLDIKVDGDKIPSSGFEINFNYRFLEEFLNSVESEEIQIKLNDANSPGVFLDPTDKSYLHLIMPVKLQS